MVIYISLKSLNDLIVLSSILDLKVNKKYLCKITVLSSPFHFKLVKTNLINSIYFCKIELNNITFNYKFIEFNSIKIEKIKIKKTNHIKIKI